jgi:DNA polymerase III subunit delta'
MIYSWHRDAWAALQRGRATQHHALLLHGARGSGKTEFARAFAQSLLCATPNADATACGRCAECHWFSQGSHPDFREIAPESLASDNGAPAEPVAAEELKTDKKAATQITIQQVRNLRGFLALMSHRPNGRRAVLIQPAESMNVFAANALLKLLEEPPVGTVFLLVSADVRRLLPTIVSRCRKLALPLPSAEEAAAWLRAQGVQEAELFLAQSGGAPLEALTLADAEYQADRREFLGRLSNLRHAGATLELAATTQRLALPLPLRWLATWCYDLFRAKLGVSVKYNLDYAEPIRALAGRMELDRLLLFEERLRLAAQSVNHPLNPRLFLEHLLLSYVQLQADQ